MAAQPRSFLIEPRLPDHPLATRFADDLAACDDDPERIRALLAESAAAAVDSGLSDADRVALRLFFEVIGDLVRQGWRFAPAEEGQFHAEPPTAPEGAAGPEWKARLRAPLLAARDEQLREPPVRRFLARMEQPRRHRGRLVSVRDLFADGRLLAADLRRRAALPEPARERLLRDAVRPYLQLATAARDTHTGLRLLDVWRYCRHTWSLPLQNQVGRRMAFLVRDAARPFHPVIGIAALGSTVVQITCRDEAVGWTLGALRRLDPEARTRRVAALEREVDRALDEVYRADFEEEGVLLPGEMERPTAAALDRLARTAAAAPRASGQRQREATDLKAGARSPLYRKKRASVSHARHLPWLEAA